MIRTSELRRRLVHLLGTGYPGGFLIARYLHIDVITWQFLQGLLVVSSFVALVIEGLRLSGYLEWDHIDRLMRDYEQNYLAGYALFLFGMTSAGLLFTPQVGIPAMLMLSVADPISGILSSGKIAKQSWVLLAMFGICLVIAAWFVPPKIAIVGAAVAAIADGIKPVIWGYVIDDNLTIPIGSGAFMSVGLTLL